MHYLHTLLPSISDTNLASVFCITMKLKLNSESTQNRSNSYRLCLPVFQQTQPAFPNSWANFPKDRASFFSSQTRFPDENNLAGLRTSVAHVPHIRGRFSRHARQIFRMFSLAKATICLYKPFDPKMQHEKNELLLPTFSTSCRSAF